MKKTESAFTKSMTLRYLFALSVLALIAIVADYILQEKIKVEQSRGAVVNLSSRLRMLSQRIALYSVRLAGSVSAQERTDSRQELLEAAHLMESSFNGLLKGDSTLNLPEHFSAKAWAGYFEPPALLHEEIREFLTASNALGQSPESELTWKNPHLQYIITSASADLLHHLDGLVNQYQKKSEAGIGQLQKLERTVMMITILVLLLMALVIFRPMVRRLQIHFIERGRIEAEREKLIGELREALASVKTMHGLIPICAGCKKIRDDRGYWNQLEEYLEKHSHADFTHGFCPECQKQFEAN